MAEQRYRVVDRLEAGGMAEVFRGEALALQGFKKQVAIKRVLPHLAQNKNFIAMFLDEARLGARLNHANIVTVFDIGAADDTYFIVMEFIDGCNLKAVIEHYRQLGRRLPVKETIYIGMEVCRGLSYAHELNDEDGDQLRIVHRDISPPNILLSKRGEIKVTDFGLAKARNQLEQTDPGVVKGKFSYLSPEAANGEPVDARTDIFALGIVLWEMLAGRRLFLGETDYQTVKLVQQANVPSLSRLNREVDSDLEEVLMSALARDPGRRYADARSFGDALAGYLFGKQLKVTSYDIANLVKEVVERRKGPTEPEEGSIIDRLIQEELLRFTSIDELDGEPVEEGQTPLSPDDVGGAQPLDALSFENPADWFSDDEEVKDAVAAASGTDAPATPGWRESGLERHGPELASLLEADERPRAQAAPPPAPTASQDPGPPPIPPAPNPPTGPAIPQVRQPASSHAVPDDGRGVGTATEPSGTSPMVWIALVVILVLVAGGTAALLALSG
ncbi:MAG: serine/threonine-protein kinase [Sandaracinaceae bacterium]